MSEDALARRAMSRVHTVVGGWRIDRFVGMARVVARYDATHPGGARARLELLSAELAADPVATAALWRDARVASRLRDPGFVAVLDHGTSDAGEPFVVLELAEGRTAKEIADARPDRRLDPHAALAIAERALDALDALHRQGLVHTNLKPEKLLVTDAGVVKLLDLGDARAIRAPGDGVQGSPAFMPPEQALGDWSKVDARTDLWALGATVFALLTGRFVHDGLKGNKQLLAAMTKPAPKLAGVSPEAPADVAAIVDRALAFDPDARWPDARAMQAAVRACRAAGPDVDLRGLLVSPEARAGAASLVSTVALEDEPAPPPAAAPPPAPAPPAAAAPAIPPRPEPAARPAVEVSSSMTISAVTPIPGRSLPFREGPAVLPAGPVDERTARLAESTGTIGPGHLVARPAIPFGDPGPSRPVDDEVTGLVQRPRVEAQPSALPFDPSAPLAITPGRAPGEVPVRVDTGTLMGTRESLGVALPFAGRGARPAAPEAIPPRPAIGWHPQPEPVVAPPPAARPAAAADAAAPAISLETYAEIKAALWDAAAAHEDVLARHGLDEVEWLAEQHRLARAIDDEAQRGEAALALRACNAVAAAVRRRRSR